MSFNCNWQRLFANEWQAIIHAAANKLLGRITCWIWTERGRERLKSCSFAFWSDPCERDFLKPLQIAQLFITFPNSFRSHLSPEAQESPSVAGHWEKPYNERGGGHLQSNSEVNVTSENYTTGFNYVVSSFLSSTDHSTGSSSLLIAFLSFCKSSMGSVLVKVVHTSL